jgi:hypothetical protein
MTDATEDLEKLPIAELARRARRRAWKRLDLLFFWRLMRILPAAEAGAGESDEAVADVTNPLAHLDDIHDSSEGAVGEALRPFYIEYLTR